MGRAFRRYRNCEGNTCGPALYHVGRTFLGDGMSKGNARRINRHDKALAQWADYVARKEALRAAPKAGLFRPEQTI